MVVEPLTCAKGSASMRVASGDDGAVTKRPDPFMTARRPPSTQSMWDNVAASRSDRWPGVRASPMRKTGRPSRGSMATALGAPLQVTSWATSLVTFLVAPPNMQSRSPVADRAHPEAESISDVWPPNETTWSRSRQLPRPFMSIQHLREPLIPYARNGPASSARLQLARSRQTADPTIVTAQRCVSLTSSRVARISSPKLEAFGPQQLMRPSFVNPHAEPDHRL